MSDFEDFMDYIYDNPYEYPARRYIRNAEDPMEIYDSGQFYKRYRFGKETIINVIFPLVSQTPSRNNRGLPVPLLLQLLITIRFYATGNFQIDLGDRHKLSQSVVCKIVTKISKQLALKVSQFIKFPPLTELAQVKRQFYERAGFPGVIGCIDCTHVSIKNPTRERGEIFRNRKGEFSVNVQIVCGPQMEIYDIVARWPGSVHDSRIFANSRCCMRFEEGDLKDKGLLVGDSGYPQNVFTFTPVLNPQTLPQQRYNEAQIRTRNVIERLNGVLKRRYACLKRGLQHKIENVPNIIVACAVLHNISIATNEPIEEPMQMPEIPVDIVRDNTRGSIIKAAFIERHFS